MIGRLRGKVVGEQPDGWVVLDVGGVGYELLTPVGTLGRAEKENDASVMLHVHTHVREEALDLYGFATAEDRRVFRLLIGLPSVGPKTALGVLSALPVPELSRAVQEGDVVRLGKVPGIGKKTAERLVLELKEKLPKVVGAPAASTGTPRAQDADRLLAALTNMGYRTAEAERAIKLLGDQIGKDPLAELLREALRHLTP
jgi:holliday junction DNA helicase RuvA